MNLAIKLNNSTELFYTNFLNDIGNTPGQNSLLEKILKIDSLSFSELNIKFSDDIWDFAKVITLNVRKDKLKFSFNTISDEYKNIAKYYVLVQLLDNFHKIQTLHRKFSDIRLFLSYLENNNVYSLENVSLGDIKDYIGILKLTKAPTTVKHTKTYIKQFLIFHSTGFSIDIADGIISFLEKHDTAAIKAYAEHNKHNDIPSDYFDRLMQVCINLINDPSEEKLYRIFAAIIILFAQTGLRQSSIGSLTVNSIYEKSIFGGEKKALFLNFKDFKKDVGNNTFTIEQTFINPISLKAYNLLDDLCSEKRKNLDTDILICPDRVSNLPVSDGYLRDLIVRFSVKYHKELKCVNNESLSELKTCTLNEILARFKLAQRDIDELKGADKISFPVSHQFRVHLCSEFYRKGIPLTIIQKHMVHLSHEMQDYYIRSEKNKENEIAYSTAILKTVLKDDSKLLGGNKDAIMNKINKFIEDNNYNIEKDLDIVIDKLVNKMPIKEKCGGVCIKSGPKRDCSKDAMTDEFYCAYGVCANHFHLYNMVDITYGKYERLLKTMKYNKEKGFLRQSEKEKHKLVCTIKDSLLPELDELKSQLSKHGTEYILKKHPYLERFTNNFDTIYKEVSAWIK